MEEKVVIESVFLSFSGESVKVQVQQERQIVREDGSVIMRELLLHESFVLGEATPEQVALLETGMGQALMARNQELERVRAELAVTSAELSTVTQERGVARDELGQCLSQLAEAQQALVDQQAAHTQERAEWAAAQPEAPVDALN